MRRIRRSRLAWLHPSLSCLVALLLLASACGSPRRPNVVLVVVDTLRADFLGSYGFGGPISDNLDRLAADSVLFENAFAPAPWTKPSIASLLTSHYPQVHGVTSHEGEFWNDASDEAARIGILSDEVITLAESLQSVGYATAAFITNPWLEADYGFAQGFDHYDDSLSAVPADRVGAAARIWLESREPGRPFFLYLHLMDVHFPYAVNAERGDFDALAGSPQLVSNVRLEEHQEMQTHPSFNVEWQPEWATDEARRTLSYWRSLYASGVRRMDHDLSGFLDYLEQGGRLEDSYFVLTSDHGEELFEHGSWNHGKNLFFHQLHIPLFIRPPGGLVGGRRVDEIVELIDLMPTMMAVAGADAMPQMQGQDLSAFLAGDTPQVRGVSYATATQPFPGLHSMRTVDNKLIFDLDTSQAWLFDVVDDPEEQRNQAGSADWAKLASQLRYRLTTHIGDSLANGTLTSETTEIPEEMLQRLRSLGYVR